MSRKPLNTQTAERVHHGSIGVTDRLLQRDFVRFQTACQFWMLLVKVRRDFGDPGAAELLQVTVRIESATYVRGGYFPISLRAGSQTVLLRPNMKPDTLFRQPARRPLHNRLRMTAAKKECVKDIKRQHRIGIAQTHSLQRRNQSAKRAELVGPDVVIS